MTPPSLYILLTLNNVENLMSNNTINIALIGYGFVGKDLPRAAYPFGAGAEPGVRRFPR
ncbi:putative oxidoreductase [Klebsiella pneumoniae]|uniref:Putative oxidoreductase n=1 Tax=Klebsiella pneumoniae TaxID=573 RepID=A0A377UZV0_KLEPN|nr:putative oxidoreductase [Klebsiella pneumoniae]